MDFFEQQERARGRTKWLVLYFAAAVVCIVAGVYLAAVFILGVGRQQLGQGEGLSFAFSPEVFLWTTGITLAVILGAMLLKVSELRSGGGVVARSIGGKKVDPDTREPGERRLLNVVEEMAIASGTPVPEVYILEHEEGINAFAAGFGTSDAAVAVTKGALEHFSRDELQGVIAHEFSHILNGDMRLNIRLIGVLFGILALAVLGQAVLRGGAYSSLGRGRRDRGGAGAIIVFGLAVMLIGYIGVFFGRLIQSAVSRQREFLADSAAVQFTRNPEGIANALRRIGSRSGSIVRHPDAQETAHLFFANGVKGLSGLGGAFATHPPLPKRIRAILPSWDGSFLTGPAKTAPYAHEKTREAARATADASGEATADGGEKFAITAAAVMAAMGALDPQTVARAREMRAQIPEGLTQAVHETLNARAVVFCLLIERGSAHATDQRAYLEKEAGPELSAAVARHLNAVQALGPALRLPLLCLALPALSQMSPGQYASFIGRVETLVHSDEHVTFFEFALSRLLKQVLRHRIVEEPSRPPRIKGPQQLFKDASLVISYLAHAGHEEPQQAQASFTGARETVATAFAEGLTFVPFERMEVEALEAAFERLEQADLSARRELLRFAAHLVACDEEVKVEEAELLRALAICLHCPLPPLHPHGS